MGKLIDGKWTKGGLVTSNAKGAFERPPSIFRATIAHDHPQFTPEENRYHLYVSYACPWAHRTLIYRSLKELESIVSVAVVHPDMLEDGWTFRKDFPGATGDQVLGKTYLYEVYQQADTNVTGRSTVPILWDKKLNTIVNNESSEIIRIFNVAFNTITGNNQDYYPEPLRAEIDALNDRIYREVNNGVYRCGFATSQEAYDEAVTGLFATLDYLEERLKKFGPYLFGEEPTEADWRLFPTLIRFDSVYYFHFKCNLRPISSYRNLNSYLHRLFNYPGIAETVHFDHIKRHYYYSQDNINPYRIVPIGPRDCFEV